MALIDTMASAQVVQQVQLLGGSADEAPGSALRQMLAIWLQRLARWSQLIC